ncbi:MAG: hypothetical protein WKF87_17535 [Chryseolinea sp.]
MSKFLSILGCLLLATTFSCRTTQFIDQEGGWSFLGEEKVNHLRENDVFKIKSRDKFTALRVYVKEGDVEIRNVEVLLINGDILKPVIEEKILQGERSRLVELGAEGRQLEQVRIWYRASGKMFSKKALVQLGGRRYDSNKKF